MHSQFGGPISRGDAENAKNLKVQHPWSLPGRRTVLPSLVNAPGAQLWGDLAHGRERRIERRRYVNNVSSEFTLGMTSMKRTKGTPTPCLTLSF